VPTSQATRLAKRPGRRAGISRSRDSILDAATELFAQYGYEGASLRSIAASADVDPGLIRHFFGDKDGLFAAVVADRTVVFERLAASVPGDQRTIGLRVTDTYLRLWEQPDTRPILLAIVRSATTSDSAAAMLRDALASKVRVHAGEQDSAGARRLAMAGSQLLGVAVARHIIKAPAIAELTHDELVAQVAPTIQRYLTGTHL
jgi:AcrR family transcriptional regulator